MDLVDQLLQDVREIDIGYGAYYLKDIIYLHQDSDLPYPTDTMNHAILVVLVALNAGSRESNTDIIFQALNAPLWPRLTMAILAAIIQGALWSPKKMMMGSKNLNAIPDSFPIHPELDHPLMEGRAIIHMAQQIAGIFDKGHNAPISDAYNHVWSKGEKAAKDLANTRLLGLAQPSKNTINQAIASTTKHLHKHIHQELSNDIKIRHDIKEHIKGEMYDLLKAKCLDNISEWHRVYHEELLTTMRAAVGAPNVPVGPSSSQVLCDAEEQIREEVTSCFNEMKTNFISVKMEHFRNEYTKADKLEFLDVEVAGLGYHLILEKETIKAIHKGRPFKKANMGEKHTHSGSWSSRPPSPDPLTPPRQFS